MIPPATPMSIAIRAHTVRRANATDAATPTVPPLAKKSGRGRRAAPTWPKYLVVFDCETETKAAQALTFGSARVLKRGRGKQYQLISEVLFHTDDLAITDPTGFSVLTQYAAEHGLTLLSRPDFMQRVFLRYVIRLRAMLVGFNLPFDLSRLALHSGEARAPNYGGFSFRLYEYVDKQKQKRKPKPVDHQYRPRMYVKSLDSKRAFIGFTRDNEDSDGDDQNVRGHFLDVRTLAFALSGKSFSLAAACAAYGVANSKLSVEEHGRITPEYIDYNRRDVLATEELLMILRAECEALGFPVRPSKLFSPASLTKAAFRAMHLRPPMTKALGIDPRFYGRAMAAFYGGRAECRVRRVSLPVTTVDVRSMYPTVAILLGIWSLLTAASLLFEDCTEAFRDLLTGASVANALDPALWRQLNVFVELCPDEDIFPVRGKYAEPRPGLNIGLNYLTSLAPFVYTGADVYASAILKGSPPTIRRAWRLAGAGTQPDLRPISFGGRVTVDPRKDDFFQALIEERVRVKDSPEYSAEERERIPQHIKLVANSGYGVFAELNRDELPSDVTEAISVFGIGDPFDETTNTPEHMGEYCFPPVAALIASGARLMLAVLERLVTDHGGTYVTADTDAMAIVATTHGGLIECENGTADPSDRSPAVRALSHAQVADITDTINALNPYDRTGIPTLLNIEDLNYVDGEQRELFAYAISAKRYVLFTWRADGTIQIEKGSEHGIGHLLSPLPKGSREKWPDVLWQFILDREFGLPHETPEWLQFPAVSRVSVTTPAYFRGFLRRYKDMPYAKRIKPYGFLMSAQVARLGHPAGADPKAFHLVAPYSTEPAEWVSQIWTDTYSGEDFAISTALSYQPGVVRVKSYGDVVEEFLGHGEMKSATDNGQPAGASARGVLQRRHVTPSQVRLIGKESNALELVEAGLIGDWGAILSTYGSQARMPHLAFLMSAPAVSLAQLWNVSLRTVRSWRRKAREEVW